MDEQRLMLDTAQAMELAIEEAYKGASFVSPNPLVGCVVLNAKGELLSKGYHQKYGEAHAEVNALKGLSTEELRGAHVIVTLEPCAHEGKTPSCAKALAKLPIQKVTYGLVDPNPLVAGQGAEILRQAGIVAEVFEWPGEKGQKIREELELVCEAFLWNFREKKVFVALKIASSLDGMLGLKNGESKWITGPESREHAHYLRSIYDAVLIGRGTFEADNPALNIRHPHIQKENKVVVVDPSAKSLHKFELSQMAQAHRPENVFWVISAKHKEGLIAPNPCPQLVFVEPNSDDSLSPEAILTALYSRGIRSVMIEGGSFTAGSFMQANCVQRLWLFMAPKLIGAEAGRSWNDKMKINHINEAQNLKYLKTLKFGNDICWSGRLKP
ncbi:MAG: bifunctional diaminohydroxyphosphoribosylaminopyrimidine deaminase/5-amino-6-(5-phosphoribosylamino)uracil reductase RibD [Bdellovibrionia bacterium]